MSSSHRILVIDDNPEIHRDFRKVLSPQGGGGASLDAAEALLFGGGPSAARNAGFEVDCASQGQEGLALVEQALAAGRPYAIAFVDMRMPPGWDGLETVSRLMPADPRLQLVICTAYSDYSWQQLAQRIGTTDRLLILKKPFDPIEILQLAHALVAKWDFAARAAGERERLECAVAERTAELAQANAVLNRSVLELRTTVAQLGRSEARFRAVFETASAAIVIVDDRGAIWQWNPGAERLFGWPRHEAVGRRIGGMVAGLVPLPANAETGPVQLAGTTRDGRRLDLEISVAQWTSDDGIYASCIIQDIGPRKQAENAMIQARDAAEMAASARSDFLAVVSHELRTPMNGILGMTDLLLETALDSQQLEFAITVRSCANALLGQINEILDFSRIEAGRMDVQSIDFDPRSASEDILELLRPQARGKGIDLILAVDASIPWLVRGDPTRFKQILTNLAGNAVKFTSVGHVLISLVPRDDVPDVLVMSVQDTGIGIAESDRAVLFEPFMQVETPNTRRHGGTGLGLAICRRLVGLMGGRLGFDSVAGQGSRFWCELPLPARPDPDDASSGSSIAGQRILHIDASATGRDAMASLLASSRVICDGVGERSDALAMIPRAQPPYFAVIIECRTVDEDALGFARLLREESGPPALLLVRDARQGLGAEARAAGAAGLLVHPLRPGQLLEALRVIRSGRHVDTGMLTRHSLAERRRRLRPWILLAGSADDDGRQALVRLERLGCRVDLCTAAEVAEACSRRAYDLVIADFAASDIPDPSILHARLPSCHRAVLLSWSRTGVTCPPGIDGTLQRPLDPLAFETSLQQMLPALDHRHTDPSGDPDPTGAAIAFDRLGEDAQARLAEFGRAMPSLVSSILLAIARVDADGVRGHAATLRRLASTCAALPLAALAEEFERLGEARDLAACAQAAGELHTAQRYALSALERVRNH